MKKITPKRYWWLAAILSYLLPGLGQFYNGRLTKGLLLHFCYTTWGGVVFIILFNILRYPLSHTRIMFLAGVTAIAFLIHLFIIIEAIRDARKLGPEMHPASYQKWYIFLLVLVVSLSVEHSVSLTVRQHIAKPYRIPGPSMKPTLEIGDYLISNQLYFTTRNPNRGDIVIHQYPKDIKQTYVKRIIGLPGDTIRIVNQSVFVDGHLFEEPYIQHIDSKIISAEFSPRDNFGPVIIPENEYFVMGDNRDNSSDSRFWGTVSRQYIHGKPAFIYWSWDDEMPAWKIFRHFLTIRLNRFGRLIE